MKSFEEEPNIFVIPVILTIFALILFLLRHPRWGLGVLCFGSALAAFVRWGTYLGRKNARREISELIAATLEQSRDVPFAKLAESAGDLYAQISVRIADRDVLVDLAVKWTDESRQTLTVTASADGPPRWIDPPLTGSIVVAGPVEDGSVPNRR